MAHDRVVVDSNVIILATKGLDGIDDKEKGRRRAARMWLRKLSKDGSEVLVPAPVFAELAIKDDKVSQLVSRALGNPDTGPITAEFGLDEAIEAGNMLRAKYHRIVKGGANRDALKVDAMIAAIAHAQGMKAVLTSDVDDFTELLEAIGSSVQVWKADAPPHNFQIVMDLEEGAAGA